MKYKSNILNVKIKIKGGGDMVASILAVVVLILIFIIYHLMDHIECERAENDRYFDKLRRTYQIQLDELREDIRVRDEIIKALGGINK